MTVIDDVRQVYADCDLSRPFAETERVRSLHWRADRPLASADTELTDALRAIGQYNEFDGPSVALALAALDCEVTLAREMSVCLYVRPRGASRREVERTLRAMRADEVDFYGGEVRAWWD